MVIVLLMDDALECPGESVSTCTGTAFILALITKHLFSNMLSRVCLKLTLDSITLYPDIQRR